MSGLYHLCPEHLFFVVATDLVSFNYFFLLFEIVIIALPSSLSSLQTSYTPPLLSFKSMANPPINYCCIDINITYILLNKVYKNAARSVSMLPVCFHFQD